MSFIRTVIVGTNTPDQLLGREQAVGFNHSALAMDPLRFNGIEPGALCGQKQGQNTHPFARGFDLLVVFTNPGTHDLTFMPGGIIGRSAATLAFPGLPVWCSNRPETAL